MNLAVLSRALLLFPALLAVAPAAAPAADDYGEILGHAIRQVMLDRPNPLHVTFTNYSQEVNGGDHNLLCGLFELATSGATGA